MIYRRTTLTPRPPNRQLRTDILEILMLQCASTEALSRTLGVGITAMRAELLVLKHHYVIRRIALISHDDEEKVDDYYYANCLWELTKHGREHRDAVEVFHCMGCALRRQLDYHLRP